MSQLKWLKDWMSEHNIEASEEQIADLRKTYALNVGEAKATSEEPRKSTARPDAVDGMRNGLKAQREHDSENLENQRNYGNLVGDMRGRRKDQDTNQTLDIMGGNYRQILGDGFASKDKTVQGMIDYYDRRDARYAELMKSQHGLANKGMTMDLIGRLIGGAAMLAG